MLLHKKALKDMIIKITTQLEMMEINTSFH